MTTKLVHLHIPKSAGTSHRTYLSKILGSDQVYWSGLAQEQDRRGVAATEPYFAVGGHRGIRFYPPDQRALYTCVLRDPVARALSYFHYRRHPPKYGREEWSEDSRRVMEIWRDRGLDPSSMRKTIENCAEFRADIHNAQCDYLSRSNPTFEGVQQTLRSESMLIGLMEQLNVFNAFFQNTLHMLLDNRTRTHVNSAAYSDETLEEPGLLDLIRELTAEDQALYDHVQAEHGGLLCRADNLDELIGTVTTLIGTNNLGSGSAEFKWGAVQLYCKGLVVLQADNRLRTNLTVVNQSPSKLVFADTDGASCRIAWALTDAQGKRIDRAQGTCQPNAIIDPGRHGVINLDFCDDRLSLSGAEAHTLEFWIDCSERDVLADFPLHACWSALHQQ